MIDIRFAPAVAILSGLLGVPFALIARHGWGMLWPIIGVLGAVGIAWLVALVRSEREMPYWAGVVATTLAMTSMVAAVWGLVSRAGL